MVTFEEFQWYYDKANREREAGKNKLKEDGENTSEQGGAKMNDDKVEEMSQVQRRSSSPIGAERV
jgi:hypothetical protein